MPDQLISDLSALLADSHAATLKLLETVDLETANLWGPGLESKRCALAYRRMGPPGEPGHRSI